MVSLIITSDRLTDIAANCGLLIFGITGNLHTAKNRERLKKWQENKFGGDMRYMYRSPEMLADVRVLLPEARSLVSFAFSYSGEETEPLMPGFGRVARYAWGLDYHQVLRERIKRFVDVVRGEIGAFTSREFTDAVPLLERAYGADSGIGFIGKNTILIRQGIGSFTFIGEIIWDVEVVDIRDTTVKGTCGTCSRCRAACPTGALVADYQLDARRCISYLTIEKRGGLSELEREAIGEWIFGCDICQEVCPFNHRGKKEGFKGEPEFRPELGAGRQLDLREILLIRDDAEFRDRFKHTAILRAKRSGLVRNACVVAANTNAAHLIPDLEKVSLEDIDPVVRTHAEWALNRLGS